MGQFFGPIGYIFNLIFTFPIFNGLVLLYHVFGDFGVSIIVLTLIIKLVLFPLTLQQLKSMKATQALQPKMAEIKKKYANNQQEQALAMQALYKEYGVNPLAGCLPLVIQLPVLYGLFYALSDVFRTSTHTVAAINANLYPFIPHFTTYPDIYLNWFTFLGPNFHFSLANADPTHILPILAGVATFIQLRMSQPKTTTATANDPTAQSTKMMQYFMPLITVFFGWTFPAGLALYWTVSSVFQAVQQYFVTGFGALLTTPNFSLSGGGSNASANGNAKPTKQRPLYGAKVVDSTVEKTVSDTDNGQAEDGDESDGPIGSQLRPARSSTARRRSSNNSASARRRSSNNARKRNASRS